MESDAANSAPRATATATPLNTEYAFTKLHAHLPSELKNVADNLNAVNRDLAAHGAHATAARLRRLDDYATVLPPESLPGLLDSSAALDELEEVTTAKYFYSWLVGARNLLALLPLLITWYSLSQATNAYQAEVNQHPNLVYQPFLILWENGFDHRMGLTFSAVAGIDAVLFIVIILVTIGIHWLERKAQVDAHQLVTRMDQSVIQLVIALGQSRVTFSGDPSAWASEVHKVIADAMKLTAQQARDNQAACAASVAAAQAATDAAQASRSGIDEIAEQTREYIRLVKSEFAETVRQLHDEDQLFLAGLQRETNERLSNAFEEASKQMREQFEATSRQMSEDIKRVTQDSHDAVKQMREESRDALMRINMENRQFLADANKASLTMLTNAAEKIDQIAERLRVTVESLQTAIEQHKQGASALVDSMAKIGDVTQRFGDNMQTFTSTATTMDTHVERVAQAHERFAQRVETIATALTSAAGETKTATMSMQATTTQMSDALSQATMLSSEVARASQKMEQAQASLPTVTQAMRDAADNLRNLRVQVHLSLPIVGRWFGRKVA